MVGGKKEDTGYPGRKQINNKESSKDKKEGYKGGRRRGRTQKKRRKDGNNAR